MPGRRGPWPLGALLLAAAAVLAVPLAGLACSSEIATTVTLTSSENPASYGDQIILTATVIPDSGTAVPSGSVTFEDSGTSLGTVTLGATGQAALVDSALGAGTQALSAKYSGSTEFASSVSAALGQKVTVQGSMTLLMPTIDPAPYGQTLLFVVSIVPDAGTGVPTGTVTLMNGGSAVGTATLSGGTAAVVVSSLGVGSHALTADYPGDGNFSASVSGAVTETIDAAATATTLTVSPTTAATREQVTLSAAVTSPWATPVGAVTFSAGGSSFGAASLSGGTATLTACFAHSGTEELTAAYTGTADFSPSTSATVALPVKGGSGCTSGCVTTAAVSPSAAGISLDSFQSSAPEPPELITVGAAPQSVNQGQSVTLYSTLYGLTGDKYPSGTVDFLQGTALLGSVATTQVGTNDGFASLPVLLSAGSYPSITAKYLPNTTAAAWYTSATSSSSVAVTVTRVAASTTLTVATSLNPSPAGQALIVTATVNHPSSSLTSTGTITFTVNGAKPEAVAVDSLGQASETLSTLAAGTQTIAASYAGDENFAASSGSTTETVTANGSPTPTPQPTATPKPTATPQPTATPKPTATPQPTSTPRPTATAQPTSTPRPGATAQPTSTPKPGATPTATPLPKGTTTSPAPAAVIVPPATTTPPSRPSGVSGSGAVNPDQFDTSAVPPIDLISLVSGIHMGSGLQIIVFLIVGNALLIAAIVVAGRRGRQLTRRSLEWAGGGADQPVSDLR
jgi:hypothetical protein